MREVDLLAVARSVAGAARAGEEVEAYAVRSRDVDVEVFEQHAPDEVIRVLGTVTAAPGDDVTFPVDVSTTTLELDLSDNHDSVTGSALAYPADVTVTTTLEGPLSHGDPVWDFEWETATITCTHGS